MIVVWTEAAKDDLDNIYQYIALDNPTAAAQVVDAVYTYAENLFHLPNRGREGRVPRTLELVMTTLPYTIAYRVVDDRTEILRVIHQSRLWPDML